MFASVEAVEAVDAVEAVVVLALQDSPAQCYLQTRSLPYLPDGRH